MSLREATLRMMAGAAPGRTQQLLDKSLMRQNTVKGGLICGKGAYTVYFMNLIVLGLFASVGTGRLSS